MKENNKQEATSKKVFNLDKITDNKTNSDEFLKEIQKEKMQELRDNKKDEVWGNIFYINQENLNKS